MDGEERLWQRARDEVVGGLVEALLEGLLRGLLQLLAAVLQSPF